MERTCLIGPVSLGLSHWACLIGPVSLASPKTLFHLVERQLSNNRPSVGAGVRRAHAMETLEEPPFLLGRKPITGFDRRLTSLGSQAKKISHKVFPVKEIPLGKLIQNLIDGIRDERLVIDVTDARHLEGSAAKGLNLDTQFSKQLDVRLDQA